MKGLDSGVFSAAQLTEISSRFSAYVQDIRELLVKEKLAVPSPDAIPDLLSRLETDARFRADLASLMRAALYREREQVGYEDLVGMLVAAAAGTEHDLTSDAQETYIREMLRFVLQSRRSMYRPEAEEPKVVVEPEPREPVPLHAIPVASEPVLARALASAGQSMRGERRATEGSVAVAEAENHESDDLVLPLRGAGPFSARPESFATGPQFVAEEPELFAAQGELEAPWWRAHSSWLVGMVCLVLGVGAGLMIHRGVPAADKHSAVMTADSSSSKPNAGGAAVGSVAAKRNAGRSNVVAGRKHSPAAPQRADQNGELAAAPAGTAERASVAEGDRAVEQPAAAFEGRSTPPPATPEKGAAVPITVVKQVVRASADDEVESEPTPTTAATHSIVQPGSAGIMAANVIFSPPPEYPAAASAARVQGEVTVRAVVDPDGNVIYARAVSGPELLRDAALEAVQKWRYRPLLYYGKPIAVTTTAILDFKFAK